jgi:hypothetical protein
MAKVAVYIMKAYELAIEKQESESKLIKKADDALNALRTRYFVAKSLDRAINFLTELQSTLFQNEVEDSQEKK